MGGDTEPKRIWGRIARWRPRLGAARLVALTVLLVLAAIQAQSPVFIEILRARAFDFYQRLKPRENPPERPVMIVDIDEASIARLGQWPWPRNLIAGLVEKIAEGGAAAVGFDVMFPEADRTSPAKLAETLPGLDGETRDRLLALPDNDRRLAEALAAIPTILGQSMGTGARPATARDGPGTSFAELGADPRPWLARSSWLLRNIPVLEPTAAGRGIFNVEPEYDGIVRRVPAVIAVDGVLHPSLSLEMLRVATGNSTIGIRTVPGQGVEEVIIRPARIRTDAGARLWIYAAPHDPARYVPAAAVLAGDVEPGQLAGKLVLIGTSAAGLLDIRSTAVERLIPGVELHAQIIETILTDTQLTRPSDALGVELVASLVAGLAMIVLVPLVGARWTLGVLIATIATLVGGAWYFFDLARTLYDPVTPALVAFLIYVMVSYATHAREEAQRRMIRGAFTRYMSPSLVEQLAEDPSRLRLGGEMRQMTILFCDVRGFTTISELYDAEGLTRLINRFLTPMTDVILERRGTIDKYMGDCIMAFWNAPLDDPRHATNACAAALAMRARLGLLNEELRLEAEREQRPFRPLAIGIGLNTGPACVGNMGSDQRFDYSVLGDTVNLASRLEGQSKTYGVTTVIGEPTLAEAPEFAALELDLIKVKGKTEAVRIHALLGEPEMTASPGFRSLAEVHEDMLAAYRAQDWETAQALVARCRTIDPGLGLATLYDLYDRRIAQYASMPPGPAWDGVFEATSK